jgi:hypothetical protein
MADVVVYDKNDPIKRVLFFKTRVEPVWYEVRDDVVVFNKDNPSTIALSGLIEDNREPIYNPMYWKVMPDNSVVLQTEAEQEETVTIKQQQQAVKAREKAITQLTEKQGNGALVRALAVVMLDEINILRQQHGLNTRTKQQLLTAITNKLNAGQAD